MKRFAAPLIALALTAPVPALAQDQDAVFDSYDAMLAEMDALIKACEVEDLSIRHAQAGLSAQRRSALMSAFAISISLRMSATSATFAGFPASRSC